MDREVALTLFVILGVFPAAPVPPASAPVVPGGTLPPASLPSR